MIADEYPVVGSRCFSWWRDWTGRAIAIVASGPSTKSAGVERLEARLPVIAIKENVDLCPWADIVYGCDAPWWKSRQGLPDYRGIKLAFDARLSGRFPDINLVRIEKETDRILVDEPGVIGSGGNSGFQALNIAVQLGASKIILVGFDMNDQNLGHWYGRNRGMGRSNPTEDNFRRWRAAFGAAAPDLKRMGVDVVNASPVTALTCFRRQTIAATLAEWGV